MRTVLWLVVLGGCATVGQSTADMTGLADAVRRTEEAFAKTMADRDLEAFARFVADDAVFINGGTPLKGKRAIVEHWKRFYGEGPAPFSWAPDLVEVAGSGQLAYSTGPVADPSGKVSARFASTWRREPSGEWRVVFDNGYRVCPAPGP